jgi:hypothetical protein
MSKTIFAFTPTLVDSDDGVPFVNLSELDGWPQITVRSRGPAGFCGECQAQKPSCGSMKLTMETLKDMHEKLGAYLAEVDAPDLQPHQQRVVAESRELEARADKLAGFIAAPAFSKVPSDERERMLVQHGLMMRLRDVLHRRRAAWLDADEPMVIFRAPAKPTDSNPLGRGAEDYAIPVARLGEIRLEALPFGVPQSLRYLTRSELDAQHPNIPRL